MHLATCYTYRVQMSECVMFVMATSTLFTRTSSPVQVPAVPAVQVTVRVPVRCMQVGLQVPASENCTSQIKY